MTKNPIMYTDTQREEMQGFIHRHFGESDLISHELDSEYVHTDSLLIAPNGQSRTCVTCGMGARKMNSPTDVERIELAISASPAMDLTSQDGFLLAGEITHISKYPFREDTWLEAGHTINATLDFKERFGYDYFAFWDLNLPANLADKNETVHFLALVPLYEEEREWIVHNNTFAFMLHLYDVYGDKMFHADVAREVCIPDWDEQEQAIRVIMHALDLEWEEAEVFLSQWDEVSDTLPE